MALAADPWVMSVKAMAEKVPVHQASRCIRHLDPPPVFPRVGTEGMSEQQAKPKEHSGKKILDWMRERAGTENRDNGCSTYDDEVRAGNTVGQTAVAVASRGGRLHDGAHSATAAPMTYDQV